MTTVFFSKLADHLIRHQTTHKVSSWEWAVNLVTAYSSEVAFPRVALYSCFRDFHKLICSQQNYQTLKLISSLIIQYLFLILNEVEF